MKTKIHLKRAKEDVQNILLQGLQDLQFQVHAHKKKEEEQGYKEQFVFVRKDTPEDMKKLATTVKKNFHKVVGQKIDIGFMTKIVNMLKQLELIFQDDNIGEFYDKFPRDNLWENDFLRHNDMPMDFLDNQKKLFEVNTLYNTEVQIKQFYNDLKREQTHLLEEGQTQKLANLNFKTTLEKAYQTTLPTFARLIKNQLFLNEVLFTDEMASGLSEYLAAVKIFPDKIAKAFYVDNCNMKDG